MLNPQKVIWMDKNNFGWTASIWNGVKFIREEHWSYTQAIKQLVDKLELKLTDYTIKQ